MPPTFRRHSPLPKSKRHQAWWQLSGRRAKHKSQPNLPYAIAVVCPCSEWSESMPGWYTRGGKCHLVFLRCAKRLDRWHYHAWSSKLAFMQCILWDHSQVVRELEDEDRYDGSIGDSASRGSQRPSLLRARIADLMGIAGRPDPFGEAQWRLFLVRLQLQRRVHSALRREGSERPSTRGARPSLCLVFYLVANLLWLAL